MALKFLWRGANQARSPRLARPALEAEHRQALEEPVDKNLLCISYRVLVHRKHGMLYFSMIGRIICRFYCSCPKKVKPCWGFETFWFVLLLDSCVHNGQPQRCSAKEELDILQRKCNLLGLDYQLTFQLLEIPLTITLITLMSRTYQS